MTIPPRVSTPAPSVPSETNRSKASSSSAIAGAIGQDRDVYFTDRGIEELQSRRGEEEVSFNWLAARLREFTDDNPEFENAVDRLATWLARLDDDDE